MHVHPLIIATCKECNHKRNAVQRWYTYVLIADLEFAGKISIWLEVAQIDHCFICIIYCISYLTVIGMHEIHGRMHPNYYQITILLVVDLCPSLAYFMITQPLSIAGKLPIKTLVARQLPTKLYIIYIAQQGVSVPPPQEITFFLSSTLPQGKLLVVRVYTQVFWTTADINGIYICILILVSKFHNFSPFLHANSGHIHKMLIHVNKPFDSHLIHL